MVSSRMISILLLTRERCIVVCHRLRGNPEGGGRLFYYNILLAEHGSREVLVDVREDGQRASCKG